MKVPNEHDLATWPAGKRQLTPLDNRSPIKKPPTGIPHRAEVGLYTVRVEPELADKLRTHGVVITGAPSSTILSTILSWVLPIFIFYLIWTYGFRRMAERQSLGGLMSIGKSRAKVYVETDTIGVAVAPASAVTGANMFPLLP